ncbi:heavy metal translocating P-type ATPase [Candidatus Woesearchaeota archaeon]|nr:heavy metal translocating P-type ATPase [Candidatus Woesearchaeota archaeon]
MHCESCEITLKRAFKKLNDVKDVKLSYDNEIAEIIYNPDINIDSVIETIRSVGYDATVYDGKNIDIEKPKFSHYVNSLLDKKNEVEGSLIKITILTFITLLGIQAIAYYGFFMDIPEFWSRFGYYIIFLIISIVLSAVAVWHVKAYGNNFTCTTGMMIGMTIGMVSGFLIGLMVGATNGMFIGSVAGIVIGMVVGTWTGMCCGVMGTIEGMMAGLMGGLMGSMTSLMLLNDHLKLIIPILVVASSVILIGLDYLIFKETTGTQIRKINKQSFLPFLTVCFITMMLLTWLMVYGPKSALFRF